MGFLKDVFKPIKSVAKPYIDQHNSFMNLGNTLINSAGNFAQGIGNLGGNFNLILYLAIAGMGLYALRQFRSS